MGVRGAIGDIQPFVELAQRPDSFVYKAYQRSLDRFVLLKVMRPDEHASPDQAQRLASEARLVARIQHPNVVAVHDYGEQDGEAYIVSEFVEGCDLAALLQTGRLPVGVVLYVLEMVARGLAAAHGSGVLHRDIKPANILIASTGDVKLADFGMASLPADAHDVRGTLAYLAPEQLRGDAADERADLFSLGATLFEMLAGRPAFQAPTRSAMMDAILNFDPMPLIEMDHRIPGNLRALCAALLDKQPERRPPEAADVLEQLAGVQAACPPATREQVACLMQDPESYPLARPAGVVPPRLVGVISPRLEGSQHAAPSEAASREGLPSTRRRAFVIAPVAVVLVVLVVAMAWIMIARPAAQPQPHVSLQSETGVDGADLREAVDGSRSRSDIPVEPLLRTLADDVSAPPVEEAGGAPAAGAAVVHQDIVLADESVLVESEAALPVPGDSSRWPGLAEFFAPPPARLHVVSDPWVAVFINGDSIGTTPMQPLTLAAGRHEVVLRNPYFPPYRSTVELTPAAEDTLAVSLWATVAQVTVQAKPWAVVYIDGKEVGTVPLRDRPFYLQPGRHVLRVENDALGVSREVTVDVRAGEARSLQIELAPEIH